MKSISTIVSKSKIEKLVSENLPDSSMESLDFLRPIGRGFSRQAYLITDDSLGSRYEGKVLKVPSRMAFIDENKREIKTWMAVRSKEEISDLFCPIRTFDQKNYKWLIMDCAKPTHKSRLMTSFKRRKIKKKIQECWDIHGGNTGYHENKGLVIIDYPWGADFKILYED